MASLLRIPFSFFLLAFPFYLFPSNFLLAPNPLMDLLGRRTFSRNVDNYGLAFPTLDQLLLPQVPVQELFYEIDTVIFEDLRTGFKTSVKRHRDLPRPCKHLRILDRGFVVECVS